MGKKAPLIDFDIGTGTSTIKYTSSILKKGSPPVRTELPFRN